MDDIDPNLKSSIYISNNLETSPLTVTPVLWLSNGGKYALPPVDLAPGGTAIVDINDGLAQQGVAPYATLSGYVELDYDWAWDALCAMVRNVDFLRSVIFQFNLQFSVPSASPANGNPSAVSQAQAQTQTLEGLWWKQEPNVNAFVALSNPTAQPVSASLTTTDQRGNPIGQYSQTISPHGTKLLTLGELPQSAGSSGGIRVTYAGAENALLVSGGLRDDSSGYSANVPFAPPPGSSAQPSTVSYAELGLMASAADPMMNFPAGTVFTPFSVVRNISGQPVSVTPNLYWMAGGVAQTARLPQITLAPFQTQVLDVMALLAQAGQKNYNGNLSLVLDVTSNVPRGAILLAGGSVDQTNNYVFQVIAQGIRESVSKTVSYWNTANGNDTMVTLWNPADEAQDFVFTLLYATGHYLHPIHLAPRATLTFNVSEILHNPTPDAEGNVIPAGLTEGRARIAGPLGNSQHILVALDSGTYNVQKATCGTNCHNCDGIVSGSVADNPFAVAVGNTHQLTFTVNYDTGEQYDVTDYSSWSSSNTSVGTVSTGNVNGVSPGSLSILANDPDDPDFFRNCTGQYLDCPVRTGKSGGSSGNAGAVPVKFTLDSAVDAGGGDLHLVWGWESSSGSLSDLSSCSVSENVTYPGTGNYAWPTPFPSNTSTNPTVLSVPGTDGSDPDDHDLQGKLDTDFRKPYFANSFPAQQSFNYSCVYNGKTLTGTLFASANVTPVVKQNPNGSWYFTVDEPIEGTDYSATINPLP